MRHRSPQVAATKGKIIKEELVISPDARIPLMGLGKLAKIQKRLEDGGASPVKAKMAELDSPYSSPNKNKFPIPKQLYVKPEPLSPLKKGMASPKLSITSNTVSPVVAPMNAVDKMKMLVESAVRTSTPNMHNVLAPQSPNNSLKQSPLASPSPCNVDDSLDASSACRKLAFAADDSNNQNKSMDILNSPVAKKHKFQVNTPTRNSPVKNNSSSSPALFFSDRSIHENSPSKPASGIKNRNKRRSVCVTQAVCDSDVEDDVHEIDASSDEENKENDLSPEDEEVDDSIDDKENLRHVRKFGGRQVIVSDCESESGSCFEVEESSEEEEVEKSRASRRLIMDSKLITLFKLSYLLKFI